MSLLVEGLHGGVDVLVEGGNIGEGLVGQMMRFEIVPDNLDIVELGCEPACNFDPCSGVIGAQF